MCVAKDELEQLIEHKELAGKKVPILFFANKMDLSNALTPVECMEQLELDKLPGKSWHITYVKCLDVNSCAVVANQTLTPVLVVDAAQAMRSQDAASKKASRGSRSSLPRASLESDGGASHARRIGRATATTMARSLS